MYKILFPKYLVTEKEKNVEKAHEYTV